MGSVKAGLTESHYCGLTMGSKEKNDQRKPSDKAAGLRNSADLGSMGGGLDVFPPLKAGGPQNETGDLISSPKMNDQFIKHGGPILDPVMGQAMKSKGSGFFDISKQEFGYGPSQNVNTKNSFGSLRDEEECFDTDLGLWENEIVVVKKFVDSNIRPEIEDYESWSASMKKYYHSLTKMNEDDEVVSETDEMARFMKSGVKS
ncbi:hypothetical protein Hanom_Chr09g00853241 [Helianthus anomalus]